MRQVQKSANTSVFAASADGLSSAAGVAVAFVLAPQLYTMGADWIGYFIGEHYGAGLVGFGRIGFLLFLGWVLFHFTRLMGFSLLTSLGLWLGTAALSRPRKRSP